MAMRRSDGRIQIKLMTSIKMAVSLWLIMLSSVETYTYTFALISQSTTETSPESPKPTTTMLPHSEDGDVPVNYTARVGSEIFFDCRKPRAEATFVIWRHLNPKDGSLNTLTMDRSSRSVHRSSCFQAPNNYRLKISSVKQEYEGSYTCILHNLETFSVLKQVFLKVID